MNTRPGRFDTIRKHPALRAVVAAALLSAVVYFVDVRTVWSHVRSFDPRVAAMMLGANLLLFALLTFRWHTVARTLGVEAPYARFLRGVWLGAFFAQLGPALVLNEITRFRLLLPYARKWPLGVSQLLDRLSGQIALAVIVIALTPWYLRLFPVEAGLTIVLLSALVILIGGALLLVAPRIGSMALPSGVLRTILNPFASPTHYACSLAIQLLLMMNFALAGHGLGAGGHDVDLFLVAPLVLGALTILPLSFADWGSREAAALLFLSSTGLTAEQIVAISLVYGGINVLSVLPAGLLMFHPGTRQQAGKGA